ncbi:MAG TPA: XRE family transcriptional regulator [Armatimonadota bacterium]|nr:XRE family transcriptional regulator [Armatimonadota bacterium]
MTKTRSATKILNKRIGDDLELKRMVAEETVNARVAQEIYDLRTEAGLTQSELAKRVGTTQPVIARLEDADYQGHSLRMLVRIASALGRELDVRFVGSRSRQKRPGMRSLAR